MVPALLPMLLEGQSFIDAQDELSVLEFMRKYSMPERINEEIFIAMGKALDFIDPDKLSMTVVLTAMNRFINEADGSQTAFLDGNLRFIVRELILTASPSLFDSHTPMATSFFSWIGSISKG